MRCPACRRMRGLLLLLSRRRPLGGPSTVPGARTPGRPGCQHASGAPACAARAATLSFGRRLHPHGRCSRALTAAASSVRAPCTRTPKFARACLRRPRLWRPRLLAMGCSVHLALRPGSAAPRQRPARACFPFQRQSRFLGTGCSRPLRCPPGDGGCRHPARLASCTRPVHAKGVRPMPHMAARLLSQSPWSRLTGRPTRKGRARPFLIRNALLQSGLLAKARLHVDSSRLLKPLVHAVWSTRLRHRRVRRCQVGLALGSRSRNPNASGCISRARCFSSRSSSCSSSATHLMTVPPPTRAVGVG